MLAVTKDSCILDEHLRIPKKNKNHIKNSLFFTVESVDKDSMDSSFELFGSVIPAHQPGGGLRRGHSERRSECDSEAGFLTPLNKSKSSLFDSVVSHLLLAITGFPYLVKMSKLYIYLIKKLS